MAGAAGPRGVHPPRGRAVELGGDGRGHCHLHPGHHAPHPGRAHRQLRGHQDPAGPRLRHAHTPPPEVTSG